MVEGSTSERSLFACLLGYFRPTREFITHIQNSLLSVTGCKRAYTGCLRPLSHKGSLAFHTCCDTVHLVLRTRDINIRAPVAECLTVELLQPVLTTQVCRGRDSNAQPSAWESNAINDCTTAASITKKRGADKTTLESKKHENIFLIVKIEKLKGREKCICVLYVGLDLIGGEEGGGLNILLPTTTSPSSF